MHSNQGKQPEFFFDNEPQQWDKPAITGQELRDLFAVPANVQIFQKIPGHTDREILADTRVDLSGPGPERFSTQAVGSGAGLEVQVRSMLLVEDYAALDQKAICWEEDTDRRLLVFRRLPLPEGVYAQTTADVMVKIPPNYNLGGIDMLWVAPRLTRRTGSEVPAQESYGSKQNLRYDDVEFCRWSRHWNQPHNQWRSGVDAIDTILRRVTWALAHPEPAQA